MGAGARVGIGKARRILAENAGRFRNYPVARISLMIVLRGFIYG